MTLRELGAEAGVDSSTISRIERGERDPLAVTAALLARALNEDMRDWFRDDEPGAKERAS